MHAEPTLETLARLVWQMKHRYNTFSSLATAAEDDPTLLDAVATAQGDYDEAEDAVLDCIELFPEYDEEASRG